MPICQEKVAPAIVVIVHEARTESTDVIGRVRELRAQSRIIECLIPHVLIDPRELHIQMSDNEIESPVSGSIGGIGAHSSFELAIRADGHAGNISHFTKGSVAIVVK